MEIEMTRKEMVEMWGVMKSFTNEKVSKKFIFAITLNESVLDNDANAVLEARKPDDDYAEYEQNRMEIILSHAEVEDGQIVTNGELIKIKPKEQLIAQEELEKLDEKYSDVIEKRNIDLNELQLLLDSKKKVEIETVRFDDLPNEISKNDFIALKPMIKD